MSDEPVVVDVKPTVMEAFSRVMEEVQTVEKKDRNRDQGFNFRGIDATVNAVGPVLRKHGVVITPTAEHIETERYQTAKGSMMQGVIVRMRFTVHGPAGDTMDGVTFGQAADSGDKAVSKAQSVAYRVFLLQALTIPTNERDPDAESHERVPQEKDTAPAAKGKLRALIDEIGVEPEEAVAKFAELGHGELGASTDVKAIEQLHAHYMKLAGRS